MIRAVYETSDGRIITVDNDVATCADHMASLEHRRQQQSGAELLDCEKTGEGGRITITRNLPNERKLLPEAFAVPEGRGVDVRALKNRRIR